MMAAVIWPVMLGFVACAIILATVWHYERERRQERWRIENKHEQRMLDQLDTKQEISSGVTRYDDSLTHTWR